MIAKNSGQDIKANVKGSFWKGSVSCVVKMVPFHDYLKCYCSPIIIRKEKGIHKEIFGFEVFFSLSAAIFGILINLHYCSGREAVSTKDEFPWT